MIYFMYLSNYTYFSFCQLFFKQFYFCTIWEKTNWYISWYLYCKKWANSSNFNCPQKWGIFDLRGYIPWERYNYNLKTFPTFIHLFQFIRLVCISSKIHVIYINFILCKFYLITQITIIYHLLIFHCLNVSFGKDNI